MKRLFTILLILLVGCVQVKMELDSGERTVVPENPKYISEVWLTAEGFDIDQVTIIKGEVVVVHIRDQDVNGHYLAMNGHRISDKQLMFGEEVEVGFDNEGTYKIIDETSKAELMVEVE